jgi:hypothetical protein
MAESEERGLHETERRYEREVDKLEEGVEKLGDQIDETRQDWERKRADRQVPGAIPPDDDEAEKGDAAA